MGSCAVAGCERPAKARGWCNTHYERWRLGRDVDAVDDLRRRPAQPCAIAGCERPAKKRGWCETHYACWRRTGDPIRRRVPTYGENRPRISAQGYRLIYRPDHPRAAPHGYVLEHRMVAWDCGIITDPAQHVHHVNGDRLDNRPENLHATTNAEHARAHALERGTITNQYGTWPLRSLSEP